MFFFPSTLVSPTCTDTDTINQPFPHSRPIDVYSELWGYDVWCHPDARRDPVVVLLWLAMLWVSVLVVGAWVLGKRGELGMNLIRTGIFVAVGPVMGWVSFGVPLVLVGLMTGRGFITGLLRGLRGRGDVWDLRRLVECAVQMSRDAWVEGMRLAVGPVAELPIQGGVEGGEAQAGADTKERNGTSTDDEEKRTLQPSPVDRTARLAQRSLSLVAIAALIYLSLATLLLCERRQSINANAITDDILLRVALTGLAVSMQAIIIVFKAPATARHHGEEQLPVTTPPHTPSVDEHQPQTDSSTGTPRPQISQILLLRFGGLIYGVNTDTNSQTDGPKSEDPLPYFGRLGPFDILVSIMIFRQLVYPHSGDSDYPHLATLIDISAKTLLLGALPYLSVTAFSIVALALTLLYLLLSRCIPNSRAVAALESLSRQMDRGVQWVKARYETVPETVRSMLEQYYFPVWILCAYGVLYVVVVQEVARFDTRERVRANNYECLDLWRDPLAEQLLWPIFLAGGK